MLRIAANYRLCTFYAYFDFFMMAAVYGASVTTDWPFQSDAQSCQYRLSVNPPFHPPGRPDVDLNGYGACSVNSFRLLTGETSVRVEKTPFNKATEH